MTPEYYFPDATKKVAENPGWSGVDDRRLVRCKPASRYYRGAAGAAPSVPSDDAIHAVCARCGGSHAYGQSTRQQADEALRQQECKAANAEVCHGRETE